MGLGMGVGLQVNKFEQVSSDDHHMSVAGWIRVSIQVPCRGGRIGYTGQGIQVPCPEWG